MWVSLVMYAYYGGILVSNWCTNFGLSGVGMYCVVLGGMVMVGCLSAWVIWRGFYLWLIKMMVVVL